MHLEPSTLTAAAVVLFVLGAGIGVIVHNLLIAIGAMRRPMATRLPAPRHDCVVRADSWTTTAGRGR